MKILLALFLVLAPARCKAAAAAAPVPVPPAAADPSAGDFETDIRDASEKIRRMMADRRVRAGVTKIWELINKRDPDYAQRVLDQLIADDPALKNDPTIRMEQSMVYFWRGDNRKAYVQIDGVIKQIEEAYPSGVNRKNAGVKEIESVAEAYFTRSSIARRLGLAEQAVADIDRAFALDPRPYMPLNKCRALLMLGRYAEAAAAYDLAYRLRPKTAESGDKDYICGELSRHGAGAAACGRKAEGEKI